MIGSSENRISYNGNGIATEFAYTFKILEKSDIKVLHVAADGTEELLTKDYYVDMEKSVVLYPGYAPGAEIPEQNRPPILPVGERLVIYREVPITQESALDKHWPFNVIEAGLDKLTIICQQIWDRVSRSLAISVSADSSVDTTFPYAPGKSFRWNDEGTSIVLMDNPESVLAENKEVLEQGIAAMNQAMTSASDAAANAERAQIQADYANESKKAANQSAIDAVEAAQKAAGYVSNVTVWNGTTEYNPPDVVMTSDGSTYRCIKANVGTNPQNHPDYWVITTSVEARTFEFDLDGNLTPRLLPITSHMWEVAGNDEIMPIGMDDVQDGAYKLADSADIDLMMKEEQHEIS